MPNVGADSLAARTLTGAGSAHRPAINRHSERSEESLFAFPLRQLDSKILGRVLHPPVLEGAVFDFSEARSSSDDILLSYLLTLADIRAMIGGEIEAHCSFSCAVPSAPFSSLVFSITCRLLFGPALSQSELTALLLHLQKKREFPAPLFSCTYTTLFHSFAKSDSRSPIFSDACALFTKGG
jgi:hypothetical protein